MLKPRVILASIALVLVNLASTSCGHYYAWRVWQETSNTPELKGDLKPTTQIGKPTTQNPLPHRA